MKKAKEYRALAREDLQHGIFSTNWLYALLIVILVYAISAGLAATGIGAIIGIIISGPISLGVISVFLKFARKEDERPELSHLLDGFKDNKLGDSVVTNLLATLYLFLWSLLFTIPGIIKSYSYAASIYLVREKGLKGNEAITESRKIMNGNKWRLFCLDLSFIGWYIVGALCLGVGVFWVDAYREVARAHFFDDLLK